MDEDPPRLRLVDADERAPAPPEPPEPPADLPAATPSPALDDEGRSAIAWMSAAIPLCIGLAILVVGIAVALNLLMGDDEPGDSASEVPPATTPGPTIDPRSLIPTIATSSTVPPTAPPSTAASVSAPAPAGQPGRSLLPLPVLGGADTGTAPPVTAPKPTTGSARLRLFNGFLAGTPLDVWDVAGGTPVKYGTIGYGSLAEIVAGGRLLPTGVELRLRFVRPGGDPSAPSDPSTGPWHWNFTPQDGSSQTLVIVANPGFRAVRIDHARVAGDTPAGRVHVVPAVIQLGRSLRYALDGRGCLGPVASDDVELDLEPGARLKLSEPTDAGCVTAEAGPIELRSPGAYAVIGLRQDAVTTLVAIPLA